MNRSERRRQERADRKRRTVTFPDGQLIRADVLTPQGVEEVTNLRTIPAKRDGVHRWMCTVAHYFTDEQAEAFDGRSESAPVRLDASNIMFVALGCVDCERLYTDAAGTPCTAGDEWARA